MGPRIGFYTRTRKFKNDATNGRGKKGPFLNLKKCCGINGLKLKKKKKLEMFWTEL